jgi:hypothetical protein
LANSGLFRISEKPAAWQERIKRQETKRKQYIVGEGITEQYYFQHLKRLKGFTCIVKPRLFGNTNVFEIEKRIVELLNEDADIVCVFDADVSKRNRVENEQLTSLKNKYAANDRVVICDSLQCIEYWFILHYEDSCPAHNNGSDTVRRLKRHIPDYDKSGQKDMRTDSHIQKCIKLSNGSMKQYNIS